MLERGTYTCEVWMMEKPEVVLQEVLQRKIFFPQLNIYQNLADT